MALIRITRYWDGITTLYETEAENIRAAVVKANLSGADLSGADLSRANLYGANLSGANLYGAGLSRANNAEAAIAQTVLCPDGELIVWKKLQGSTVARLRIPHAARRSSAAGRKCRAEFAQVCELYDIGSATPKSEDSVGYSSWAMGERNEKFAYKAGEFVYPDSFDADRWNECAPGIHFFFTRAEAENY